MSEKYKPENSIARLEGNVCVLPTLNHGEVDESLTSDRKYESFSLNSAKIVHR